MGEREGAGHLGAAAQGAFGIGCGRLVEEREGLVALPLAGKRLAEQERRPGFEHAERAAGREERRAGGLPLVPLEVGGGGDPPAGPLRLAGGRQRRGAGSDRAGGIARREPVGTLRPGKSSVGVASAGMVLRGWIVGRNGRKRLGRRGEKRESDQSGTQVSAG